MILLVMQEKIPNFNHENKTAGEKLKHRLLTATELPATYYDIGDYETTNDYLANFFDWESTELKNTVFSKDEAIKLAHTSSQNSKESDRSSTYYGTPMYDWYDINLVTKYILPLVPKDQQKEVLDNFITVLLDQVDHEKIKHDNYVKQRKEADKNFTYEFNVKTDTDRLRRSITQHPEILTDEQFLEIIDKVPPLGNIVGVKDYSYLPAWVLYGMRLRYGYRSADTLIIQSLDDENQKEKMDMVENYFSKVTIPGMKISRIEMSSAEKEMLIEKVKEYALEIYKPIQSVNPDTKGAHFFTHVSNQSGLKCLLPKSSGEDRWGTNDWTSGKNGGRRPAVYLQEDGRFSYEQKKMLSEANSNKSFSYSVYISEEDFKNHDLIWEDDRWDNGYMISQPIILDDKTKFTWDILDRYSKEGVIETYEYNNGFLPSDVKKELFLRN